MFLDIFNINTLNAVGIQHLTSSTTSNTYRLSTSNSFNMALYSSLIVKLPWSLNCHLFTTTNVRRLRRHVSPSN